jgi:16S rRNA (uracil1498-N3)-methyltransferase
MIRLFVPLPLSAGADIAPSPDQARYLTGVMRRAVGDEIALFNGADGEWRAVVAEVGKRGCRLRVEQRTREQETVPDLDLVVALVKRTRLETIVEKATELGARRIRLAVTRFTNADHARPERLRAIAIEAAEQTGRLDVPEVAAPEKLDRLLADWAPERRLMFCDEAGDARPALKALGDVGRGSPWAVLIGPEGGFSAEERQQLRALTYVTPVTLGPRILRADTAAISALTLWQAAMGDWVSLRDGS